MPPVFQAGIKCYLNVGTNRFRSFRIRRVNSRVTINNIEEKISTGFLYISIAV